jgi:hypothetical protein
MKSLLFQGETNFTEPSSCVALPCREEVTINLRKDNRIYRFVLRDKIVPEDPYFMLVKASAFAIRVSEPFNGRSPKRSVKDFLIKDSVVI